MFFAGLWERWGNPGEPLETFTILTTQANETMGGIHDRMPVILGPESFPTWLGPASPPAALAAVLQPCPAGLLMSQRISTLVNSPRNNQPECIEPLVN